MANNAIKRSSRIENPLSKTWSIILGMGGNVGSQCSMVVVRGLATGRIEAQVDPIMAPWDAGPFLTIASEAGGRFTTLEGDTTVHGGSGISSNGLLHDEILRELAGGQTDVW